MINKINFFPVSNYNSNKNINFTSNLLQGKNDTFESCIKCQNSNPISFKGRVFQTTVKNKGILNCNNTTSNETAFFRDSTSNEIIKRYILNNLGDKEKINIVSAACSSGEEAITFSMLLDCIKDKVHILGFDISDKAISLAQSGIYKMQNPYNIGSSHLPSATAFYKDSYLTSLSDEGLTPQQKGYKNLFNDFFVKIQDGGDENLEKLGVFVKSSYYQLRPNKATNCDFIQGDIYDIDKILNEKADVILFRNAMYHFLRHKSNITNREKVELLNELKNGYKTSANKIEAMAAMMKGIEELLTAIQENSQEVIKPLIEKMDKCLNPNGIICFGETEDLQILNWKNIVPPIMLELGYVPLDGMENIWQKLK